MTHKKIKLAVNTEIQSLLITCSGKGEAIINNIIYDKEEEKSFPLTEISYPIRISSVGKKLITFAKPITANSIELLGTGLEYVRGVSVNDSTMANELQEQIDNITADIAGIKYGQASGTVNGSNKNFTSPHPFFAVFINGLPQLQGTHFTKTSATTFELQDAPITGDLVTTLYIE